MKTSLLGGIIAILCFALALYALFFQPFPFVQTNDRLFIAFSIFGFVNTVIFVVFDQLETK